MLILRYAGYYLVVFLMEPLYLNGVWLIVDLQIEDIILCLYILLITLNSILSTIGKTYVLALEPDKHTLLMIITK